MKTKSLKELRQRWNEELAQENGQDWLKKNADRLQTEWDYLVDGGFIMEEELQCEDVRQSEKR